MVRSSGIVANVAGVLLAALPTELFALAALAMLAYLLPMLPSVGLLLQGWAGR